MINSTDVLQSIHRWDVVTLQRVTQSEIRKTSVKLARTISRTGDGWFYPLVPVSLYLLDYSDVASFTIALLAAFGSERCLYFLVKNGFKRRRPDDVLPGYRSVIAAADEFSFPSGHTSAAFLLVTALTLSFGGVFPGLYVWAIGVGASRVILGVHFPSDIIIGASMGTVIANLTFLVLV
ncbi:MAG: phosphatase PAP2 family protein [Proteobacteria bacterium]|jgi:undecaprenyl-diphosphatase|nr:phosphatase PAP2 family protein [Pseudomonadota bacterium]MDA1301653.1 phosphatase PAP2 family protein [Pseudomonadota bacterium]